MGSKQPQPPPKPGEYGKTRPPVSPPPPPKKPYRSCNIRSLNSKRALAAAVEAESQPVETIFDPAWLASIKAEGNEKTILEIVNDEHKFGYSLGYSDGFRHGVSKALMWVFVVTLVVFLATLGIGAAVGHAQTIYDCTLGAQLRDVSGSVRPVFVYHAYPFVDAMERFMPPVIEAGNACCADCRWAIYDYEPWNSKLTDSTNPGIVPHVGSVDPHFADIEGIQRRHQQYATALAAVTPKAKELGARLGIYGYLSLAHKRLEDINQDGDRHNTWRMEQDLVLKLPVLIDGKETTLLAVLNESGGAVWIPWYVPENWNKNTPGFINKAVKVFTRQCEAIEAAGGKAIPLLGPTVAGGDAQVLPEIQRALIQAARERGSFGVWAKPGEVTDEFRALLTEGTP